MLFDSLFNDFCDVFKGRCKLLHFVVTQGNIVSELTVVTSCIHSIMELSPGLLVLALLIEDTAIIDHYIGVLLIALPQQSLGMLNLVLLVADKGLQENNLLLVGGVLDALTDLESLHEVPVLVVTLGQVQLVLGHVGVVLSQLLVDTGRVQEVLAHEVAVGQQRHRPASGAELQLVV